MPSSALIESDELYQQIGASSTSGPVIVDASFSISPSGSTPFENFQSQRIKGAVFFDINEIADPSSPLPHTAPSPEYFEGKVRELGINKNDKIVIYDQSGIAFAAARAWWMFRLFGHDRVHILNGGLPAWKAQNHHLAGDSYTQPERGNFKASFRPELLNNINDIVEIMEKGGCILDARPPDRFTGKAADIREGMHSGHIPGSHNVFFMDLIDEQTGKLKKKEHLKQILSPYFNKKQNISCSCGSGVTACVIALALSECGQKNASVYDGSWAEWGNKKMSMPIDTLK